MRAFLTFLLAVLVHVGLPCQRTWIVDRCNGPRADFTDLAPAVAAAAPGDIIYLYQGCLTPPTEYQACHIDKPLSIIGVPLPQSTVRPTLVNIHGRLTVSGIDAGSRLVLANMFLSGGLAGTWPNLVVTESGLSAWDCQGQVVIENLWYSSGGVRLTRTRFERCASVSLRGCDIYGRDEPVTFIDSVGAVRDCLLRTSNGSGSSWYGLGVIGTYTAPTIHVRNSQVIMSDTLVYGGDPLQWSAHLIIQPSEGAVIESGALIMGPGCRILGGDGIGTHISPLDARGLLFRDPRAAVLPSGHLSTPITMHSVQIPWLTQNQPYVVGTYGPPGGFALLAVGPYLQQPITGPLGTIGLDIDQMQLIAAGPLSATLGFTSWQMPLGWQVSTESVYAFQAAFLAPDGAISLSQPTPFVIGWGVGRQL